MAGEKKIVNAKITDTMLGYEDHGIFTAYLTLDYGGAVQGFGGYDFNTSFCTVFIESVLEVAGVDRWERLIGKHIRVEHASWEVIRIGHIIEDKWFNAKEEANKALASA